MLSTISIQLVVIFQGLGHLRINLLEFGRNSPICEPLNVLLEDIVQNYLTRVVVRLSPKGVHVVVRPIDTDVVGIHLGELLERVLVRVLDQAVTNSRPAIEMSVLISFQRSLVATYQGMLSIQAA